MKKPLLLVSLALSAALLLSSCGDSSDPVDARIGSQNFRLSQAESRIAKLAEPRRTALEDTVARRAFIREMVETRALAMAAKRHFAEDRKAGAEREAALASRELCRYAQQVNVYRRIGHTSRELAQWFAANRAKLGADAEKPFEEIEQKVAEAMELDTVDLAAWYAANGGRWHRPGRREVSAIECSKERMKKVLAALKRGESFESVAKKFSEHSTAAQGGYWGWIGDDERHPVLAEYPGIAEFLRKSGASAGDVSEVFEGSPEIAPGKFLVMKFNSIERGHRPALDEVRGEVEKQFLLGRRHDAFVRMTEELRKAAKVEVAERDPSAAVGPDEVLATKAGRPYVKGAELLEKFPKANPKEGLEILLQWKLWEKLGLDQGLDSDPEYLETVAVRRDNLWVARYVREVMEKGFGLTPAQIDSVAASNPVAFAGFPEAARPSVAAILVFGNPEELEFQRLSHPEVFGTDSAKTYAEQLNMLVAAAEPASVEAIQIRHVDSLAREVGVVWIDSLWSSPSPRSERAAVDRAVELIASHRPAEAVEWTARALRLKLVAANPSLRDSLTYLAGRALMDAARPQEAVGAFTRYLLLYPKAAERCKALFMRGFLQDNNLHEEQVALSSFEALVSECPDSELLDDAKFMIEDIKCGRCKTAALAQNAEKTAE